MNKNKNYKIRSKFHYLLKNAFRSTLRNKVQMVGLIILIFLISAIFSLMYTTLQRVENSYKNFISNSNLHDFVVDLRKVSKSNIELDENIEKLDSTSYAQWAIGQAKNDLIAELGPSSNFVSEYREGRMIFRTVNDKESLFKVIAYDNNNTIDKLIIAEGRSIQEQSEVVLSSAFAKANNYQIGSYICLQTEECNISDLSSTNPNNPLKIVGLGSSADYSFLQADLTTPIPNQNREALAYVHPSQFGLLDYKGGVVNVKWQYIGSEEKLTLTSAADREIYFVCSWKASSSLTKVQLIEKFQQKINKYFFNSNQQTSKFVFSTEDGSYDFSSRVNTIKVLIIAYRYTAIALLLATLTIAGVIIALITKKRVENSRTQIGILKSLGFPSFILGISFIVYPFIASIIGGVLGFSLGMILQIPIMNIFNTYFTIPFGNFSFNLVALIFSTFGVFLLLGLITIIAATLYVKGSPLKLLRPSENVGVLLITRLFSYLNRGKTFNSRFRWAIFSKSLGKMVTVIFTMFLATVLLTFSITAPKALNDMRNATYRGIRYESVTEYETPVWNSPLSSYGVYNLEYDASRKGVGSNFYSNRIMKEEQFTDSQGTYSRITSNTLQVIRLSNLNYALFDFEFYYNAILSKFDTSRDLEQLKTTICALTVDNWNHLPESERDQYFVGDCMIAGTTRKAPYFVRSKLESLVRSIKIMETELAIRVLKAKDLTNPSAEYTNSNPLSEEDNNKYLARINEVTNDVNYNARALIAAEVFQEVRSKLNNCDTCETNVQPTPPQRRELNRYLTTLDNYLRDVTNKLQLKKVFNIQFNLLTYNPNGDELATYFVPKINKINGNINSKTLNMKAYGIERTSELHELVDKDNNNLIESMYENRKNDNTVIPIIINQTVAKHLKISQGDVLDVATNKPTLYSENAKNDNKIVSLDKWILPSSDPQLFSAIENEDIIGDFQPLYASFPGGGGIDYPSTPSNMYNSIINKTAFIKTNPNETINVKVIGIQESYGDGRIFLPKEDADIAMGYYKKGEAYEESIHFKKMREIFAFHSSITIGDDADEKLKTYFDGLSYNDAVKSAFPLFNVKFSLNRNIQDITDNISLAQSYGDFSPVTLQGEAYENNGVFVQRFISLAQSAITYALPIAAHQNVFDEVKGIADSLLIAFMIIALLISFVTILVTSNIIITENGRLIATMKVLGYNDYEINWLTLGMYLPIVFTAFIVGFPVAWIAMGTFVKFLATNTTWVMPFYFSWWLLFVILFIVITIYVVTFLVGWYILRRLNAIDALKIDN